MSLQESKVSVHFHSFCFIFYFYGLVGIYFILLIRNFNKERLKSVKTF